MTVAWPITLPQSLNLEGSGDQEVDPRVMTPMAKGPGKMRLASSSRGHTQGVTMNMSLEQLGILSEFWRTTLVMATLPFTLPSPQGGDPWLVRFAKDGLPHKNKLGGDVWSVSFTLDVLP